VTTVDQPVRTPSTRGAIIGFWWFGLSAVAVAVFAPLPYLVSSLSTIAGSAGQPIALNYAGRPGWVQVAFYAHIVFAGLALLLSPLQFVARLRDRAPRVHRVNGRVVLGAIGLASLAGLVLAPMNVAGPVGTAGFGALAVLWATFAVLAFRAIRRGDVVAHRRWMVRTFALTYAAVTLRLWLGVLITLFIVAGVDPDAAFGRAYVIVPFLAWVPNLLVAQWWLRRGDRRATSPVPPSPVPA
jgi:uncharacterized membrane protein